MTRSTEPRPVAVATRAEARGRGPHRAYQVWRGIDGWCVRLRLDLPVLEFASETRALAFAIRHARAQWESDGMVTSVRQLRARGRWQVVGWFGEPGPDP